MLSSPQFCSGQKPGREAKARIDVDVAGGRTVIRRQHVGYPFHVTRGFYLDDARPDLLTLYLQSASGGLYAGDDLQFDVNVSDGAALCVTTQASTVVHDGKGVGTIQRQRVVVEAGAFCAMVYDPAILFPGADLTLETEASVAEGGLLILIDGFSCHDPENGNALFVAYRNRLRIARPGGNLILSDVGDLRGDVLIDGRGPTGRYRAAATMTVIGPPSRMAPRNAFACVTAVSDCMCGTSAAPDGVGQVTRILAATGGDLVRSLEAAFHVAAEAALGKALARRRK